MAHLPSRLPGEIAARATPSHLQNAANSTLKQKGAEESTSKRIRKARKKKRYDEQKFGKSVATESRRRLGYHALKRIAFFINR